MKKVSKEMQKLVQINKQTGSREKWPRPTVFRDRTKFNRARSKGRRRERGGY